MAEGVNRIYLCTIHGSMLSEAQNTHTHTHTHTNEWQGNYWITTHQFKRAAEGCCCEPISWTVPAHACRNWGNLCKTSVKTDRQTGILAKICSGPLHPLIQTDRLRSIWLHFLHITLQIMICITKITPRRYPYFDVAEGLAWSYEPIILVVFWLVNLYSLFVYIEHKGDESPTDYAIWGTHNSVVD
jgi:hypothetical protein